MALIAAVLGSLFGAVFGVIGMVAFDLSILGAFGVYMFVSLGCIGASASALLMAPDSRIAAYGAYEDELDADWKEFEARSRHDMLGESTGRADQEDLRAASGRRGSVDRLKGPRRAG